MSLFRALLHRSRCFVTVPCSIAIVVCAFSSPAAQAQEKMLTFEELYGPGQRANFYGDLPYVNQWLADGKRYLEYGYDNKANAPVLMAVDARTGQGTPFYDAAKMESALEALPSVGKAGAARLARPFRIELNGAQTTALFDYAKDLYVYEFATGKATRLTNSPDAAETNTSFSPDGQRVAFVRGGNLYTVSIAAPTKESQITKDGGGAILNGRLDWVYEEEVYGRGDTDGYRWSPDSKAIAFLRIDDTPIKPFEIVDQLPRLQNTEAERYPKAGDPNPLVSLGVAPGDGSGTVRFVDLAKYPEGDRLIVRFAWHPDSKHLTFQAQNRNAKFLDLNVADVQTGAFTTLVHETAAAWVEIIDNPRYLPDGSFLWQSDRTGYRHIYRYDSAGKLVGTVTKGDWDVRDLLGTDTSGNVFFTASEHSPIAKHAYRARLDGSGSPLRLTQAEGDHDVRFNPTFTLFLDTHADAFTPPDLRLREAADGKEVRILGDNEETKRLLARYKRSKPQLVSVKARDGFVLEGCVIRPPDFDPAKKYPVFCPVYAGPGLQTVRDDWGGNEAMWYQFMAQQGYIVWMCDNRSASGKGVKSQWTAYKNLGPGELADIEDGLNWLKAQGGVDANRIAISGWSFGGFMTQYALTHSQSFKVGIAGAGVSDWRLYDTIYTERYMDTPQANPDGYRDTSPTNAARNLSGRLLLLHGMMDDNVHVQNTVQLAYALQKAGKDFEMMLYPSPRSRHGIGDPQQSLHLHTLEWKFLKDNL